MSKIDDMVSLASSNIKELEDLKAKTLARQGPNMTDYISDSGPSSMEADLRTLRSQAAANIRTKYAKAPAAMAEFGGQVANRIAGPSVGEGSSAGLRNEKSAYIGLNNTGYDAPSLAPNRPAQQAITMTEDYVKMTPQSVLRNVTDYRKATSSGARLLANRFI